MKKLYTAPAAELIFLTPAETISTSVKPWEIDNNFFWTQNGVDIPESTGGSVSTYWYDFGTEELD